MKSFPLCAPPALASPSPPHSPFARGSWGHPPKGTLQPVHQTAKSSRSKSPRTLASAGDPPLLRALSRGLVLALSPGASRPPTAAAAVPARAPGPGEGSPGARDAAAAAAAAAGSQAEEGNAVEERDWGSEIPIRNPDHSAACREECGLSGLLRAATAPLLLTA